MEGKSLELVQQVYDCVNTGSPPFDYGRKLFMDRYDWVHSVLAGENPPPYELEIQPSPYCNAECGHCFGRDEKKLAHKLFKMENMDRVVSEVLGFSKDGYKIENVKFCGSTGDPLMNSMTLRALEQLDGKRYTRLFTNGLRLGEYVDDEDYLARAAKADSIVLSLDAASDETMHRIKSGSGRISLVSVFEAVRKMKEYNPEITFDSGFVISRQNFWEIKDFAKRAKDSGIDNLRYRIDLMDRGISGLHEEILDDLREAKSLETMDFKVVALHTDEQVESTEEGDFRSKDLGYPCFTSNFWVSVGSDGNMYPCGHVSVGGMKSYGSLLEKSFSEIWEGENRKEVMENLPSDKCNFCSPFSLSTNKLGHYLRQLPLADAFNIWRDIKGLGLEERL